MLPIHVFSECSQYPPPSLVLGSSHFPCQYTFLKLRQRQNLIQFRIVESLFHDADNNTMPKTKISSKHHDDKKIFERKEFISHSLCFKGVDICVMEKGLYNSKLGQILSLS